MYDAAALVHQILAEEDLAVLGAVGRKGAQRLPSPLTGGLIDGRDDAPCARLGKPERYLADTDSVPTVLGVRLASVDDDIGSESIHRNGQREPSVEPIEGRRRKEEKGKAIGERHMIPGLGRR